MTEQARPEQPTSAPRTAAELANWIGAGHTTDFLPVEERETVVAALRAYDRLIEIARRFTDAAHDARDALNRAGVACPASIALAAEEARNLSRERTTPKNTEEPA